MYKAFVDICVALVIIGTMIYFGLFLIGRIAGG
jgi:hypothetical protein